MFLVEGETSTTQASVRIYISRSTVNSRRPSTPGLLPPPPSPSAPPRTPHRGEKSTLTECGRREMSLPRRASLKAKDGEEIHMLTKEHTDVDNGTTSSSPDSARGGGGGVWCTGHTCTHTHRLMDRDYLWATSLRKCLIEGS